MSRPERSVDDLPLAAYGGTGMEEEARAEPADVVAAEAPEAPAPIPAAANAPADDLPVPEDERPRGPSVLSRVLHLFRTSRVAAGAGFAVVIVVGLLLLSSGGSSPAATANTPTQRPSAAPVVVPPSGDASVTLTGAEKGTFSLTGLAGGQQVDAATVALGWGDSQQTMLTIAGPVDRGTRSTDERLVLTISVLVEGVQVTFTSTNGECTVGMAQVSGKVQGSIACKKLKSPDGKLTIEASGNYRT